MGKSTLTDMQRIILSGAAMRLDHKLLPVPKSLQKGAAAVALSIRPLLVKGLVAEVAAEREDAVWREDPEVGRMALAITPAGMEAIGVSSDEEGDAAPAQEPLGLHRGGETTLGPSIASPPSTEMAKVPRDGSKLAVLIETLSRPSGATIAEMMGTTGWQAHSVRGAMSGALKRKLRLTIDSELIEGRGRVYRIVAEPAVPGSDETSAASEAA
jgi:hypothetical protein